MQYYIGFRLLDSKDAIIFVRSFFLLSSGQERAGIHFDEVLHLRVWCPDLRATLVRDSLHHLHQGGLLPYHNFRAHGAGNKYLFI